MSKTILRLLSVFFCVSLLTGCIKSPLKLNIKLKPVQKEQATYTKTVDGVTVQAHKLSKKECKKLLGITIKNTAVVQVTVTNPTSIAYQLHQHNIVLDKQTIREVTHHITTRHNALKYGGIITACVIGVPLLLAGSLAAIVCDNFLLPQLLWSSIIAAGLVSGLSVSHKRKKVERDIYAMLQKLSPKTLCIAPSTTESILLFLDKNMVPDSFDFGLCDATSHTPTHRFSVSLT